MCLLRCSTKIRHVINGHTWEGIWCGHNRDITHTATNRVYSSFEEFARSHAMENDPTLTWTGCGWDECEAFVRNTTWVRMDDAGLVVFPK
jgi:hypothetical protein